MAAARLDLPVLEKGSTYRHSITWKDSTGTAINLTGCTAVLQVRPEVDSPTVLLELSTSNGGIFITPLLGSIDLYVSPATGTSLLSYGGEYDLEVHFPGGDVKRLVQGEFPFSNEVTR